MDCSAMIHSPGENEAFRFLTYMLLSHIYNLKSSACLFRGKLDDCNALGMYRAEEEALLFVLGSLSGSVSGMLRVARPSTSTPSVIEMRKVCPSGLDRCICKVG